MLLSTGVGTLLAVVYSPGREIDDWLKEREERWSKIVFFNFFP